MAIYRQLMIEKETGWYLVSPESFIEAMRVGWLLWRHPGRVAMLTGIKHEHAIDLQKVVLGTAIIPAFGVVGPEGNMYGEMVEADFEKDTILFKMEPGYVVQTGRFAIARANAQEPPLAEVVEEPANHTFDQSQKWKRAMVASAAIAAGIKHNLSPSGTVFTPAWEDPFGKIWDPLSSDEHCSQLEAAILAQVQFKSNSVRVHAEDAGAATVFYGAGRMNRSEARRLALLQRSVQESKPRAARKHNERVCR